MSTITSPSARQAPHVAYLTAAYPAVSHTFIAREVAALRARGVAITTFSIRRAPDDQLLTEEDRRSARETWSVLPVGPARLLQAHTHAVRRRPRGYLRVLRRALAQSAGGVHADLWQLFYFVEAILVWDEARRRDVDHVHAHFANVASAVAMLAADFGARDGLTWSFTMHGPTEFDDVTRYALAEKVHAAAFVACISDYCRSQLMKLTDVGDWDKLTIIHCGLAETAARARPAAPGPKALRVLCVGRLVPEKGQLILVRAVALMLERGVAVELVLVGDGPARAGLEREVSRLGLADHVEVLGALGTDRVAEQYAHADVFCLASFAEGVPVVLMEAMAAGLPVVTTRIAGIAELVDDGVCGRVVTPGRPEPIADALQLLAVDPHLRERWGSAGRERVMTNWKVSESATRLLELFAGARSEAGGL